MLNVAPMVRRLSISPGGKTNSKKSDTRTSYKFVLVGDSEVGKTSICQIFQDGSLKDEYKPTSFDTYEGILTFEKKEYTIELHDTAGQIDMDRIREMGYHDADIFLICCSLDNFKTYLNVTSMWLTEVEKKAPGKKKILVGTKEDLVKISSRKRITRGLSLRKNRRVSLKDMKKLVDNKLVDDMVLCSVMEGRDGVLPAMTRALHLVIHGRPAPQPSQEGEGKCAIL